MRAIFGAVAISALMTAGPALAQTSIDLPPTLPKTAEPYTVQVGPDVPSIDVTPMERSPEYRFQLDFHVKDAALAKLLPAGWISNAATSGAAKDANVRLIFIDRQDITGPGGKVLRKGSDRLVYVAAPVKKADGSATGQMILAGISENGADAPGLFGKVAVATSASMNRSDNDQGGILTATEDWNFAAADGSHVQMHVKYTRAPANFSDTTTSFYNPADPSQAMVFKTQQATDITRNVTTIPPDRVADFSYKVSGGAFATLFDGTEKPLSWDSQPTYYRMIEAPQAGATPK